LRHLPRWLEAAISNSDASYLIRRDAAPQVPYDAPIRGPTLLTSWASPVNWAASEKSPAVFLTISQLPTAKILE